MSDSISGQESVFQLPWGSAIGRDTRQQNQHDALTAELQAARARETAWLREKSDLLQRQDMLTQEFEHRLVNGLQIIVSLLSLQSRTLTVPSPTCSLVAGMSRSAAKTTRSS
jgi:two-component system, sensor histidine kinase PdtaS